MSEMKHTATFAKGKHVRYRLPGFTTSELLADCDTEASAEMISNRVNAHEQLLSALKAAHKLLTAETFDSSDGLVTRCEEIARQAEQAILAAERGPEGEV